MTYILKHKLNGTYLHKERIGFTRHIGQAATFPDFQSAEEVRQNTMGGSLWEVVENPLDTPDVLR